ncbi:MAG: ATPase, T2SS/T4P/T4SS family [Candidatus Hodarchaeota archaeon]
MLKFVQFIAICNLTIIGRTDSGKTTLLNALDLIYPENFRKIYVEDVVETVNQDPSIHHQLKFQSNDKDLKPRIIKNLLHRTPDVLILGEILTKEETDALFHCLSVGLKGMQTIHANSCESLLTRLRIHFNIDPICLKDLDFIVYLKKIESGNRRLIEFSEVNIGENHQESTVLIKYSPKTDTWNTFDIEKSNIIKKFLNNSKMDKEQLREYLMKLEKVLKNAVKNSKYKREELIRHLNQVYIDHADYF